jgi:putative ABC transport system substrate-binding protein
MPVIGFLSTRSPQEAAYLVRAFHRGLSENSFVDGQSLTVDFRWADGHYDRLPALAAELVRRSVKVIAATGGEPATIAAKAATATIPIVFAVGGDPVRSGLVASYGQPGGNITGVSILTRAMEAKRIGLLREVVPGATTMGFLMNPTFPAAETQLRDIQEAVRKPWHSARNPSSQHGSRHRYRVRDNRSTAYSRTRSRRRSVLRYPSH